jgi:hypothetical protein
VGRRRRNRGSRRSGTAGLGKDGGDDQIDEGRRNREGIISSGGNELDTGRSGRGRPGVAAVETRPVDRVGIREGENVSARGGIQL